MKQGKGFSLLEVMVALTIVSILAVILYPSYIVYVRKSYRSEATQALLSIQLAEEQWRATNSTYGSLANVYGGVSSISSGRYTLSITGTSASGYTATATATGDQLNDAEDAQSCKTLTLVMSNTVVTTTPTECW